MPEGDTVLQTAARLHEALAGQVLTRSDLRVPRFATADLTGRTVLDVTARGKHLLTRIEGGLTLHSHLRMDGAWRVYAPDERWRGGPGHQIRAILGNAEHTAVGYRLPVLELLRTSEESRAVGHLGPDLLGPDWDPGLAVNHLLAAPERPLGEALLDQRNLAGIGNVYKCELCFLARVTPWLPVGALPDGVLPRLVALAERLLHANRDRPTRTTTITSELRTPPGPNTSPGPAPRPAPAPGTAPSPTPPAGLRPRTRPPVRVQERLYVYGRARRPCLRCGTPVRLADQDDRPTYWCPGCQSGPTP
ncbi:DNA glycosylase [Streptomyces sp. ATCC51928]|uniref:DNA-(apurinic or apyrimidinic site) lyase n=3 Tax=Streptomyces griseus group TaxID=629295 RepID=A0ABW2MDE5_9ACTN|nr:MULTISPECIES: DNA-formamidopyrimidine glycosylase family protein [unclassified Streptomyces]MDX3341159.1 DNA glycosylase [Streptomyces sp. ME02-6979.5a]MDX3502331.1 DNA glycosylase [Streptomyces sp. ATCC51928]MDX5522549.1 DNA glycosylase [Streptomyces sp. DE06-01C]